MLHVTLFPGIESGDCYMPVCTNFFNCTGAVHIVSQNGKNKEQAVSCKRDYGLGKDGVFIVTILTGGTV